MITLAATTNSRIAIMPKRRADAGDDGGHKAVTASTIPIVKKQRAVCKTWLEFIAALEALVGKYSETNACTETFAAEVRTQVLRRLNTVETDAAEASWAAGNSVTACGRKVGDRAVVRAACCVLLSDMTTIATSSAGQAKLWAAFPGGPEELLAALGPDAEEQLPDGYSRMRAAINSCGRQDDRIKRIHRVLLADQASSMERLKEMDYTEAARVLRAIKGFGPKLTACVLSFTCDHAVLAVDTNVAKAVKKLGWVQPSPATQPSTTPSMAKAERAASCRGRCTAMLATCERLCTGCCSTWARGSRSRNAARSWRRGRVS